MLFGILIIASIDFTIGEMRIKDGETNPIVEETCLKTGSMVIVATQECLKLPSNLGAITVSPVSQSIKGLLILNQGHVDPGFSGYMRFIIINMSQETVPLRKGDIITSVLFYELSGQVSVDYEQLESTKSVKGTPPRDYESNSIPERMLERFSDDFMHVDERARKIAENIADEKVREADLLFKSRTWVAPVISAILGGIVLIGLNYYGPIIKAQAQLGERLAKIEGQITKMKPK